MEAMPKVNPIPESAVRAAEKILTDSEHGSIRWFGPDKDDQFCWQYRRQDEIAAIIARECKLEELAKCVEALRDAGDFINALHQATEGEGRIEKNSILRYGERLKTTARKIDERTQKALRALDGEGE